MRGIHLLLQRVHLADYTASCSYYSLRHCTTRGNCRKKAIHTEQAFTTCNTSVGASFQKIVVVAVEGLSIDLTLL